MPPVDPQKRNTRGLLVVILLGLIFLTLLALIVLKSGGTRPEAEDGGKSEALTVLPVRIRIRTEPNAKAPVVATATSGETLQLKEERGAWVMVQTADGLTGWAERANLERTAERERRLARHQLIRRLPSLRGEIDERTTLYAGPGIFYPVVGELPGDTDVTVYTRDHDYFAIDYKGTIAYADVAAVDVTASGAPQLDVRTTTAAATQTAPTTTTATETIAATDTGVPPPMPPLPVEAPPTDRGGVYAVVPPGGTQPEEIDRVVPHYPAAARRAGVAGAVVIRGIVRRDGTIDEVEVLKDQPYGLGEAAREAVRRWRFRPATYRGEPIDVYYMITVNFRLR